MALAMPGCSATSLRMNTFLLVTLGYCVIGRYAVLNSFGRPSKSFRRKDSENNSIESGCPTALVNTIQCKLLESSGFLEFLIFVNQIFFNSKTIFMEINLYPVLKIDCENR